LFRHESETKAAEDEDFSTKRRLITLDPHQLRLYLPAAVIRLASVPASFPPARLEGALRRVSAAVRVAAANRRFAAGRRLALAVVRRFEVVRRFTGRRFFRDERDVAARFLRFAIYCLLSRQAL
jgi:hypothetical protein